MARKYWRCFHCDELFWSPNRAMEHFGNSEFTYPACRLTHYEGRLVEYIRRLEAELADYRSEAHALLDAAYAEHCTAQGLAKIAEERGYDKGVSDVLAMVEGAREVVHAVSILGTVGDELQAEKQRPTQNKDSEDQG